MNRGPIPLPRAPRNQAAAVAGLLWALGFPALPVGRWMDEFASVGHLVAYDLIWWGAALILLLHLRFVENDSLAGIGFKRPRPSEIAAGVAGGIITVAGLAVLFFLVLPRLQAGEGGKLEQLQATPAWWRIASVFRAAFCEEVFFRGYALSRLEGLLQNRRGAILLSWMIFTVEHVGVWGWGHLLIAGFGGAMLTLIFLWRRNLWVSIAAHLVIDGIAVLA